MRRLLLVCALMILIPGATVAQGAPGDAEKTLLGTLELKAWDARKDVFFKSVSVWRQGCTLVYSFTYRRARSHPLKLRLHLALDAGPATTATPWTESKQSGDQMGSGFVVTPGCWAGKAGALRKVTTEALGDPPRPASASADGRIYLGRVTFNRWGSSGDVYYRHIKTWKKGCALHYQFLYKRHTAERRRLKLRVVFDAGTLQTDWVQSKAKGWRVLEGVQQTQGCWAPKVEALKTAGFESERY